MHDGEIRIVFTENNIQVHLINGEHIGGSMLNRAIHIAMKELKKAKGQALQRLRQEQEAPKPEPLPAPVPDENAATLHEIEEIEALLAKASGD